MKYEIRVDDRVMVSTPMSDLKWVEQYINEVADPDLIYATFEHMNYCGTMFVTENPKIAAAMTAVQSEQIPKFRALIEGQMTL